MKTRFIAQAHLPADNAWVSGHPAAGSHLFFVPTIIGSPQQRSSCDPRWLGEEADWIKEVGSKEELMTALTVKYDCTSPGMEGANSR